jgi:hypothetical protein
LIDSDLVLDLLEARIEAHGHVATANVEALRLMADQ